MDFGLLVSLPTESIAVRVALASLVAVLLAGSLVRAGVRTPRVRLTVAFVPALSILAVTALFLHAPALPSVWRTVGADAGLSVPVRDTYLSFRPATIPFVLALWASVVLVRVAFRTVRHRRAVAELAARRATGAPAPPHVRDTTRTLATGLRITPPDVVVVPAMPGGAAVVGMRDPVLLVDQRLVASLDDQELAGVIAHELAHVQRRDNQMALGLSLLRDVFFFVPGSRWSTLMLLREREHVADTVAAELTGRPGALASGLLKVLESRSSGADTAACSPLLSEGTLVARVQALCDDRPPPSRTRGAVEVGGVVAVVCAAVLTAALVPPVAAGQQQEREALGLLLSDVTADGPVDTRTAVFRSFDAAVGAAATTTANPTPAPADDDVLDVGDHDLAGAVGLEACARGMAVCRDRLGRPHVSMPPAPIQRLDDDQIAQWRLEPIVRSDSEENALFWFSRLGAS